MATADGQVVYKITSPYTFYGRRARILKVLPKNLAEKSHQRTGSETSRDTIPGAQGKSERVDVSEWGKEVVVDWERRAVEDNLQDKFAHLATIEFNVFASSKIRFGGEEFATQDFFQKKGRGAYGRNRIFAGPDGLEYKWVMGARVPELFLNDGSDTPVARLHRPKTGLFKKPRPSKLEILKAGEHMQDLIVVTFVYIEKLRMDREESD